MLESAITAWQNNAVRALSASPSAADQALVVRTQLDGAVFAWLDSIPSAQEYNDLRQRIRCRDDEQFRSAFLELYLHESLIRTGYTVTIHPKVQGTSRRPDFLAERKDLRFFI